MKLVRKQVAVIKDDEIFGITCSDVVARWDEHAAEYDSMLRAIKLP